MIKLEKEAKLRGGKNKKRKGKKWKIDENIYITVIFYFLFCYIIFEFYKNLISH